VDYALIAIIVALLGILGYLVWSQRHPAAATKASSNGPQTSSSLMTFVSLLVIVTFVGLASTIIWRAVYDPNVLDNIEGLLTALAVIGIIASKIIDTLLARYTAETPTAEILARPPDPPVRPPEPPVRPPEPPAHPPDPPSDDS
jgi:magnesium-transporting ATPase (P-type)